MSSGAAGHKEVTRSGLLLEHKVSYFIGTDDSHGPGSDAVGSLVEISYRSRLIVVVRCPPIVDTSAFGIGRSVCG